MPNGLRGLGDTVPAHDCRFQQTVMGQHAQCAACAAAEPER